MRHLLEISQLSNRDIGKLFVKADQFSQGHMDSRLAGKTVANLFYENSTRTRLSFELAAKHLQMNVLNLDISSSSEQKGETVLDSCKTIQAMGVDYLVMRHHQANLIKTIANQLDNTHCVNAGDGMHAHPSQALLDLFTIYQEKADFPNISVALLGDIKHSRVAGSLLLGLKTCGVSDIRLCAPSNLLAESASIGNVVENPNDALEHADVVVTLRVQKERFSPELNFSLRQYQNQYCLNEARLKYAKKDAIVMHPGPVNRDIEIAASVADGPQSVILKQVKNGVCMRMAIFSALHDV